MMSPLQLGILAALYNWSLLLFNVGFTQSHAIQDLDDNGMWSPFGQLMVLVWGGVFWATGLASTSSTTTSTYYIWYSFVVEKMVYVVGWLIWHSNHSALRLLHDADFFDLAPLFHCLYGAGDFVFAILFYRMGYRLQQQHEKKQKQK